MDCLPAAAQARGFAGASPLLRLLVTNMKKKYRKIQKFKKKLVD
jgi:hypothetical protein